MLKVGRHRKHQNTAAKQQAYRERLKEKARRSAPADARKLYDAIKRSAARGDHLATWIIRDSPQETIDLLSDYFDKGVNFFDDKLPLL
jgi:hypothetical protein